MAPDPVSPAPVADRRSLFDMRRCQLGEGPFWHPLRHELFWFDILAKKLLSKAGQALPREWNFDDAASAGAWIDHDHLLLAFETSLSIFDISTGSTRVIADLEADVESNRSNDGRADPWGGFWIGTMGKQAEVGAGTIYRWYGGELRRIVAGVSIPNAICFDLSLSRAYFADTAGNRMFEMAVDPEGWPVSDPALLFDTTRTGITLDGAIVDRHGKIWVAGWDAGTIFCVNRAGHVERRLPIGTARPTCPAFGGIHARDLFVTTAAVGLDDEAIDGVPPGATLKFADFVDGQFEPRVRLML